MAANSGERRVGAGAGITKSIHTIVFNCYLQFDLR
jgi:hypothetical protein